jgi:nitrate/nitrite transporter NarK
METTRRLLHPMVLAPAVAIINSLGNLGGFVAPYGFGFIKEATGQVTWGLYGLAITSALAAILVLFIRKAGRYRRQHDGGERRDGRSPVDEVTNTLSHTRRTCRMAD